MLQLSGNRSVRVEMYSKVRARLGVVNIWRALPASTTSPASRKITCCAIWAGTIPASCDPYAASADAAVSLLMIYCAVSAFLPRIICHFSQIAEPFARPFTGRGRVTLPAGAQAFTITITRFTWTHVKHNTEDLWQRINRSSSAVWKPVILN